MHKKCILHYEIPVRIVNMIRIYFIKFIVLVFFISGLTESKAQTEDTTESTDSLIENGHPPRRATLFSAIMPGLGQAYNKRYWKIPIIYAGIGSVISLAIYNDNKLKTYSFAYDYVDLPGPVTPYHGIFEKEDKERLKQAKKTFKHNRDLSLIVIAGVYVLNIIDATVDAQMFDFDVTDDLSFRITPNFMKPVAFGSHIPMPGVSCVMSF